MNEERIRTLKGLEERLGWHFADIALLDNALTHRSFVNENVALACRDNERLEFLGDAVLELTVSDMLMRKFPDHAEGELSKLRASVVNEQPLAELARRFGIGEYLLLGKGEEGSGGRMKSSLLANAFESVIAAMYLDGGFDRTAAFIGRLFEPLIEEGEYLRRLPGLQDRRPGDQPDPLPGDAALYGDLRNRTGPRQALRDEPHDRRAGDCNGNGEGARKKRSSRQPRRPWRSSGRSNPFRGKKPCR